MMSLKTYDMSVLRREDVNPKEDKDWTTYTLGKRKAYHRVGFPVIYYESTLKDKKYFIKNPNFTDKSYFNEYFIYFSSIKEAKEFAESNPNNI